MAAMTQLLTLDDAAGRLSISRRKLFDLLNEPGFPPRIYLSTRMVRIEADALDTWIKSRPSASSGAPS
jgi:predicted DNA-binding transcriptional regulator AlpA